MLELTNSTYEYPVAVKSVKLADDGMSATVDVFTPFVDDTKYVISVEGFEDVEKTMSVGKPVSMTIAAKDKNPSYILTTGTASELVCTFYDEEGVDVTTGNENVIFRLETRSTDGSYYLAGKNLTIKKEGVVVNVIAEYQGWIENGKRVGTFSAPQEFIAMDAAKIEVVGVDLATVAGTNSWDASLTMRKSADNAQLKVILVKSNGEKTIALTNNNMFDNNAYKVTFTAINPDVAVVSSLGKVTAFKTGTASFYVNLHTKTNTGYDAGTPIAVVDVVVEADAAFSHIGLDNYAVTIGTAAGFNTAKIIMTAYDTYNQQWKLAADAAISLKCISDGFAADDFAGAVKATVNADQKVDINIDAAKIYDILDAAKLAPNKGDAAVVYFSVSYNNKTEEFSVMIQVPDTDEDGNFLGNYIQIDTSATSIDALRVATNDDNTKTEDAKTVSFTVYEMNNGVKVKDLVFGEYGEAKAVTANAYVYKVTKDGQDFKGVVSFVGNKVEITLSTTAPVSNSALQSQVVSYNNAGAGTYEFALYKCYGDDAKPDEKVLVQEYSSVVVVSVGDAGAYTIAGDKVSNTVKNATAEEILKCFVINDRGGNAVVKDGEIGNYTYYVDYTNPENSEYVYVKEITFYESVGDAYVPYVVTIDDVLTISK